MTITAPGFEANQIREALERTGERLFLSEESLRSQFRQKLEEGPPGYRVVEDQRLPWPRGPQEYKRVDLWLPDERVAIELKYAQPHFRNASDFRRRFLEDLRALTAFSYPMVKGRFAVLLSCHRQHWEKHWPDDSAMTYGASWTDYSTVPQVPWPTKRNFRLLIVEVPHVGGGRE